MKKVTNIVFVIVCAIVVMTPIFFFNWQSDQISETENRQLAELGSLKEGLSTFMKGVDNYVNDRIGFREQAVQLNREITIKHLNYRHSQVLIGHDGWLFYCDDLPDYTGTNNTPENVNRYVAILKQIDTWCKERDIQFIFAIGPNKSTIYSEYMPSYVKQADITLLDSLVEKAQQENLLIICPKQELLDHKDEQELYMRLDTHWNPLGSRYMIDQLTEQLDLPEFIIPVTTTQSLSGDLLSMLGIGDIGSVSLCATVSQEKNAVIEYIPNTQNMILNSQNTESFICYRDSFTTAMTEYFTYYFNGPLYWTFAIDFDYVDDEKPRYLILECVERYIPLAIESNACVLDWNLE